MLEMLEILENIPNINKYPLHYVFEIIKLKQDSDKLWLEFGVASGRTINYISKFTDNNVYGFDTFTGLPEKWRDGFEKGSFNMDGEPPNVNKNVVLIKGRFEETLSNFLKEKNQKISFLHLDADLYSSTKYVLDTCKSHIDENCVVVFDELVNYPGFDSDNGELKAFWDFINENKVDYSWIGMNGSLGMSGYFHENVALTIHSIK
jgi:hypothetical protein